MEKRKVEGLLDTLGRKSLGKEGICREYMVLNGVDRLKALSELKVLGRSVENTDPIVTTRV